jgi:membrane protease subunit (stomatin/prohibitin family)
MEQEEIWKDIEGYGGKYKISSFGRCLTARGNEFKYSNANGYRMVILYDLSKKVKNLEWVTCSENHIHAFKNGRIPIRGERCKSSKITDNQAIEIKKLILNGHTIKDICEITKISYYIVKGIKTYKKWNHITI